MFENKEIKLNKEAFDIEISKLTEDRDTLVKAKDKFGEEHRKKQELYKNLEEDIKYMKSCCDFLI